MTPNTFSVGPLQIRAQKAEVKEENLPYKFIQTFKKHLLNIKYASAEVYNLTINGNGRYYFSPQLNLIGVYVLNDFLPSEELFQYIEEIKRNILKSQDSEE